MKKTAAILLAAVLTGGSLSAQEESSYSVTVDFPYVTDYVFRGVKLASDSIQPSVEFAAGDFYAGIWTSQPVSGGAANEFDFYMGHGFALSDTWSLDLGATYYYYPETPSGDESFEPFIGASGDFGGGMSGSGYFYYDTELETTTLQFGLGQSFTVSDSASFDLAGDYGFVSADGGEDYSYWGISGTYSLTLNDTASGYVGAVYADSDLSGEDSHFYVITGITMGF
jgi:uncharacterized protein (TIGR02001 family)